MANGQVFPWVTRSGVYCWLQPLTQRLKITYTPHMSRHAFATEMAMQGHDRSTIAAWGAWSDERSVDRYTHGRPRRPGGRTTELLAAKRGK